MLISDDVEKRCHIRRGRVAAMTDLRDHDVVAWPCPRLAPHPPARIGERTTLIDWTMERPARLRVLDYTCSCRVIVYELLGCGGRYMIRRTHQTAPPRVAYAGPWPRRTADLLWARILTGEAS